MMPDTFDAAADMLRELIDASEPGQLPPAALAVALGSAAPSDLAALAAYLDGEAERAGGLADDAERLHAIIAPVADMTDLADLAGECARDWRERATAARADRARLGGDHG